MIVGQSESMQVYTLPDGRIHAEIHYQNEDSTNAKELSRNNFPLFCWQRMGEDSSPQCQSAPRMSQWMFTHQP
jgi:hypothetical protein